MRVSLIQEKDNLSDKNDSCELTRFNQGLEVLFGNCFTYMLAFRLCKTSTNEQSLAIWF